MRFFFLFFYSFFLRYLRYLPYLSIFTSHYFIILCCIKSMQAGWVPTFTAKEENQCGTRASHTRALHLLALLSTRLVCACETVYCRFTHCFLRVLMRLHQSVHCQLVEGHSRLLIFTILIGCTSWTESSVLNSSAVAVFYDTSLLGR